MKLPDNPRKPTKSNPIKMRKLLVFPDYFILKNKQYQFEDITKLDFDFLAFKSYNPPISMRQLKIEFNISDITKRIKIESRFFSIYDSKKTAEGFYSGYHYMAEKSFSSRYQKYKNEFSEKGYFRHSDELFFKDRVTDAKGNEIMLKDDKLYLKSHVHGILLCTKEKTKRRILPSYNNAISCFFDVNDIDILKKLLDEFYGLKL